MARAFIRVCIQPGFERKVRDFLRGQPEVLAADITAGEQDLIVQVQGETFEAILATVVAKVRANEGVKITWTNFVLE